MEQAISFCAIDRVFVLTESEFRRKQIYNEGKEDEHIYFDLPNRGGDIPILTRRKLLNNLALGYRHFRIQYHGATNPRDHSYYFITSPQLRCA